MPKPLPLAAQFILQAGSEIDGRGHELAQFLQPRLRSRASRDELLVPAPRRQQLAPGARQLGPTACLVAADVAVEYVELVAGTGEPPLLELTGHRDQPLAGSSQILARDAPPPRIRARA